MIVDRLLDPNAAIDVVVDDSLFRRWGPKVFGAFWTHDGSAQDPNALGRGNRWVIVGIVVELPFCSHPVCLPVLFGLWRGKGTDSPVRLAGELISTLAQALPGRDIHVVGDAAYHGTPLLIAGTTITTRLPANAALYTPAPSRTGRRGRPRLKGHRLGRPAELAAGGDWQTVKVSRYGRIDTVELASTPSISYGAFGNTEGTTVLVREPGHDTVLAIFTTDTDSPAQTSRPAMRTAGRSRPPSPPANNSSASARPATGCSARSNAPCRFSSSSTARSSSGTRCTGATGDDLTARRHDQPWYPHKDEPSFEDMLAKLRRTLLAARITGVAAAQPDPHKYREYEPQNFMVARVGL